MRSYLGADRLAIRASILEEKKGLDRRFGDLVVEYGGARELLELQEFRNEGGRRATDLRSDR